MKRSKVSFLILTGALAAHAQPDRDVIGTWKMGASRSNFSGPRDAPDDVVIRFERK